MTMRQRANGSLLLLAIIFIVALALYWFLDQPWWAKALIFVAEAGMVGALADWFAVTALFRHPLGIRSFPHTAIVPRNRNKLVEGVVKLVEEQLLNKQFIEEQLQKINFTELLIAYLDKKQDSKLAEQIVRSLLPLLTKNIAPQATAEELDIRLKQAIEKRKLAPYLNKGLVYLLDKGYDQQLLDSVIDALQKRTLYSDVKPAIKQLLESEKDKMLDSSGGGWLTKALFSFAQAADAVNFDDAADVIYRDLLLLLAQLKDRDHELRVLLQKQLYELAAVLENEQTTAAIEQWKEKLLQQLALAPLLKQLIQAVLEQLQPESNSVETIELTVLQKWLARFVHQYWKWFKSDNASQELVEKNLRSLVHHLIKQEHALIGKVVRSTLEAFSEDRLVQFIESKVEVDLQRIRVNGALIGAVIGALLYGVLHGVYKPLLAHLL